MTPEQCGPDPLPRWMNQAEIVRRAPLLEESENDHLPPHYSDMLDKKVER